MELEFTTEQEELRDGVRAVLERECPPGLVRAIVEKRAASEPSAPDDGPAAALWTRMVELGWPALTVPEPAGGLGLGAVELAVVVEELGRVIAPGPLLTTISQFVAAVRELGSIEQHLRYLGPVAEQGRTGALAIAEADGSFDPARATTIAARRGAGWLITGEKHVVMEAPVVDDLVIVAREPDTSDDDGIGAFVVARSAPGVTIVPVRSYDASRLVATVILADVAVEPDAVLGVTGPDTAATLRRVVEEATVALALEIVGVTQTIFDVTLEYAKQREQFGVPIGSFQAIKHKFADMLVALERARATGYFAALTLAERDERSAMATAMAKAAAGDAQRLITKEGIQVHGGVGYTWEHDMHLYVRRAKADAALFGTATTQRARVAELLPW